MLKTQSVSLNLFQFTETFQLINIFKEKPTLVTKFCGECQSYHYISFAINEKSNEKLFYEDAHELVYFQVSKETIVERNLLQALKSSFFFQHCTFRNFCEGYNYRYANASEERFKLNYKRLCDIFYTWNMVKYYKDFYNIILVSKCFLLVVI